MSHTDIAIAWVLSFFAALTIVAGKIGLTLFGMTSEPPSDPLAAAAWERKRRWLLISEVLALPSFATVATAAGVYFHLPVIAIVILAMALGALGFGFLLNALQFVAKKRLGSLEGESQ